MAAVPAAAAVAAACFLVRQAGEAPWPLVALSGLFIAQMGFLARTPARMAARQLWEALVRRAGRFELELRGGRLLLGSRLGPFRRGRAWSVAGIRRLVVRIYCPQAAGRPVSAQGPGECGCLAMEYEGQPELPLVGGWSAASTLVLAEDLWDRLVAVGDGLASPVRLRAVEVVRTSEEKLSPGPVDAAWYRHRRPSWLAWQLAGVTGLGALTGIATLAGPRPHSFVRVCLAGAWLLEIGVLAATFYLTGRGVSQNRAGHTDPAGGGPAGA
jgi:hypothetical protein